MSHSSSQIKKEKKPSTDFSFLNIVSIDSKEGFDQRQSQFKKVEDRLISQGKKYERKKQLYKQELADKEVKDVQMVPNINKNTVYILMQENNRMFDGQKFIAMKVEDRLT